MRTLGVVPARYGSTRFPGKPLAIIDGKPMIQRVYEQSLKAASLNFVAVATDDSRIEEAVRSFGGNVIMTSPSHQTGTDRCWEVLDKMSENFDVVINIQGDEPYINPEQIDQLASLFKNSDTQIGTLIKAITSKEELFNENKPKVLINKNGRALYFSRAAIPYQINTPHNKWLRASKYWKHIGIYGYRVEVLKAISELDQSPLELAERLEQLRWLENGYNIMTAETNMEAISIDTPKDLELLAQNLKA